MKRAALFALAAASVLMVELLSTCPLFAAIVTDRNDVTLTPPPGAAFRGSPGIESRFVPYGTYTAGRGSGEVTRVTAKLAGVVASAFDGTNERGMARNGFGQYGETVVTNSWIMCATNTVRIMDYINRGTYPRGVPEHEWYTYTGIGQSAPFELALAHPELREDGCGKGGIAADFGSRALDRLVGETNAAPPIATAWTTNYPFRVADSNRWATVWPTFAALSHDTCIWPTNGATAYPRDVLVSWMDGGTGLTNDSYEQPTLYDEFYLLRDALATMPLTHTIQDVLAADTGLAAADFSTHWATNTTRLDWKRLGIICQLERQMETTYWNARPNAFPFFKGGASTERVWTGTTEPVAIDEHGEVRVRLDEVSWTLHSTTSAVNYVRVTSATESVGPTMRATKPAVTGGVGAGADTGEAVRLDTDTFLALVIDSMGPGYDLGYGNHAFDATLHLAFHDGPPRVDVQLTDVLFDVWLEGTNSQVRTIAAGDAGEVSPSLRKHLRKAISAAFTREPATTNEVAAFAAAEQNLRYPRSDFGRGFVGRQTCYALDQMVATSNAVAEIAVGSGAILTATYVHGLGGDYARWWRLNPRSGDAAANSNFDRLLSLQGAVRSKFAEISGFQFYADGKPTISSADVAQLDAALSGGEIVLRCVAEPYGWDDGGQHVTLTNGTIYISANVTVGADGIDGAEINGLWDADWVQRVYGDEDGVDIGFLRWESAGVDVTLTNGFTSAAVEGCVTPALKTVWKFKNLRDPNL